MEDLLKISFNQSEKVIEDSWINPIEAFLKMCQEKMSQQRQKTEFPNLAPSKSDDCIYKNES